MKRVISILFFIGLFSSHIQAQNFIAPRDSVIFNKYFFRLDFQFNQKDRNMQDSFYYGSNGVHLQFGTYLRKPHTFRPFVSLGVNCEAHSIMPRYYDSISRSYHSTQIRSLGLQGETGFELRPSPRWILRVNACIPVMLFAHSRNEAFAEYVHLLENRKFQFQPYDIRYGILAGRTLYHQQIFLCGSLNFGSRPAFSVPTADGSRLYSAALGLQFHFAG